MRTLLILLLALPAYAKAPNPADFPLAVQVSDSEDHSEDTKVSFGQKTTNTDCRISGNNANCQSTAAKEYDVTVTTTLSHLSLGDLLYTVECRDCSGEVQPGAYKARWKGWEKVSRDPVE
jgi:hypothetical protein